MQNATGFVKKVRAAVREKTGLDRAEFARDINNRSTGLRGRESAAWLLESQEDSRESLN